VKKSDEVLKATAAVAEAAKALKPNHYVWIVSAILKHFQERLDATEKKIMLHTFFAQEEYLSSGAELRGGTYTRQSVIDDAKAYLPQYRDIVRFLIALRGLVNQLSVETAGEEIADYFRGRAGVKKAGS
jgi:hypothetical protein